MLYHKVKGHVDPSSCPYGTPEWRDAVGNQYADQYARLGALLHQQASQEELDKANFERALLSRFLPYVSKALLEWEPVGPTTATRKHLLPKLASKPDLVPGASGRTFLSDVLGPWAPQSGNLVSCPFEVSPDSAFGVPSSPPPPTPHADAQERRRRLRGKQPPPSTTANRVSSGVPPKRVHHEWRHSRGRWLCRACLKVSRARAPSRSEICPGFNKVMADLLKHPNGHALSYSSFLDGAGIMILCTRCGGHCSSNRRSQKLSEPCRSKPSSTCGAAALARLCKQQHPVHARGDAVVLDAWRALSDLT